MNKLTLDLLPLGVPARIISVGGTGALRCRLLDMGLIPRTQIQVQKVAPLGDPIVINLRGYEMTIRKEDARLIEVEAQVDSLKIVDSLKAVI